MSGRVPPAANEFAGIGGLKWPQRFLIVVIAVIGVTSATSAREITTFGIRGEWRVYKAELTDPEGVQAYGDEELRALVGSRLLISRNSARWIIASSERVKLKEYEGLFEVCRHPVVKSIGDDNYQMACRGGKVFGPGLTMFRDGRLVVVWWDGVDLYLRKLR